MPVGPFLDVFQYYSLVTFEALRAVCPASSIVCVTIILFVILKLQNSKKTTVIHSAHRIDSVR